MTLTKANIVEAVAEQIGYTKHQSSEIIEILLEIIKRTLESGEDMMLEPRWVVTFRCSRQLRDKINEKQH